MVTGIVVGAVVAWWLIKRPPKIVKWILNNKVKSLMIAGALFLGRSAVQKIHHQHKVNQRVEQIKQEVRARDHFEQKVSQTEKRHEQESFNKDSSQKITSKKIPISQEAPKTAEEQASVAVMQNAFVSSPEKDMSARSGPRAAFAHERMKHFVNMRAQKSVRPDLSGMHTILIYQQQNPTNHVVLHVGFHAESLNKAKPYQVYESMVKTQKGIMPMIGKFNIRFTEVPDIVLGISANENGAEIVNAVPNMGTIDITKNQGRTALQVAPDGSLAFLTDEKAIQEVFSHVNLNQVAPLTSRGFKPYNVKGQYKYPQAKQTKAPQFKTNDGR